MSIKEQTKEKADEDFTNRLAKAEASKHPKPKFDERATFHTPEARLHEPNWMRPVSIYEDTSQFPPMRPESVYEDPPQTKALNDPTNARVILAEHAKLPYWVTLQYFHRTGKFLSS